MMVLFSVAKSVLFSFTNEVKKPMTISTSLEEVYHQTVVFGESISPKIGLFLYGIKHVE